MALLPAADHDEPRPLIEHLIELRRRLIYAVLALAVAFALCWPFAKEIFDFLTHPLFQAAQDKNLNPDKLQLVYTQLTGGFFVNVRVAFFAAACIAFPVIATQLWLFIAPGLYQNEQKTVVPFLLATPIMFIIGASTVYLVVLPVAYGFLLGFQSESVVAMPDISDYLSLTMQLMFGFGLIFELPVLLALLVRAGITTSRDLRNFRRYAIVLAFVVAAVLTPPDPMSQIAMAVPTCLLYEGGIWIGRLIERKRAEAAATEGDAEAVADSAPGP